MSVDTPKRERREEMRRFSVLVSLSVEVEAEDKLAAEILVEQKVSDELTSEYEVEWVKAYWAEER